MRVLAVDYGEKRFGFAVSDPGGEIALALKTVETASEAEAIRHVVRIAEDTDASEIVVGLPLNMNGTRGPMAEKVLAFVERLRAAVEIAVTTYDERLSTRAVERSLVEADLSRRKRKGLRDKLAAQAFLQGYLDWRQHRRFDLAEPAVPEQPGGDDA